MVQCDETKINHNVKAHRGRTPKIPTWVLTIVDTSFTPSKGYAEIISDKRSSTILPIIERVVRPGSHIYTDEGRSYFPLGMNSDYNHQSVVHKYNFVNPETGVHTQHVESFNNKMKRKIKDRLGIDADKREEFINEFLFFDWFKEDCFNQILLLLKLDE